MLLRKIQRRECVPLVGDWTHDNPTEDDDEGNEANAAYPEYQQGPLISIGWLHQWNQSYCKNISYFNPLCAVSVLFICEFSTIWALTPVKQESPPAWMQEAYRLPCSKCSLYCSNGGGTLGTPHHPDLARVPPIQTWDGVPPPTPDLGWHTRTRVKTLPFPVFRTRAVISCLRVYWQALHFI